MVTAEQIQDMFGLRNVSISGDEIICSCPFVENHVNGDRNPSFGISMSKGVAHCFSCGWSGNIVQLAKDLLGMTYGQAYEYVYSNITVDDMLKMTSRITEVHPKTFNSGYTGEYIYSQEPHPYWKSRGFNEQTIGKWQLGYDPSSNRVVVPVYQKGVLVGWSKRAVDDVTKPKWVHSLGLQKNKMLFGIDNFTGDSAILVEAPLSVVMLDQYGISNAIASFGCRLSKEQAKYIRSNYNKLLIWYDPDDAGFKGTMSAIKLLKDFLDVYVIKPTRDDPAAMSCDEVHEALKQVYPAWLYETMNGGA